MMNLWDIRNVGFVIKNCRKCPTKFVTPKQVIDHLEKNGFEVVSPDMSDVLTDLSTANKILDVCDNIEKNYHPYSYYRDSKNWDLCIGEVANVLKKYGTIPFVDLYCFQFKHREVKVKGMMLLDGRIIINLYSEYWSLIQANRTRSFYLDDIKEEFKGMLFVFLERITEYALFYDQFMRVANERMNKA